MKNNKFANKKPKELTTQELLELVKQVADIEYNRRIDIKQIQTSEDGAQDLLCYWYSKNTNNNIRIEELKNNCTMSHFINSMHFQARNGICSIIRAKNSQRFLYNTSYLSQIISGNKEPMGEKSITLEDTLVDTNYDINLNKNVDLYITLNKIDNTIHKDKLIKYENGDTYPFSYRNLARAYYDLFKHGRIDINEINKVLFDNHHNILPKNVAIDTIKQFKKYIKNNYILGGA